MASRRTRLMFLLRAGVVLFVAYVVICESGVHGACVAGVAGEGGCSLGTLGGLGTHALRAHALRAHALDTLVSLALTLEWVGVCVCVSVEVGAVVYWGRISIYPETGYVGVRLVYLDHCQRADPFYSQSLIRVDRR